MVYPVQLEAHTLKKNETGHTLFEVSIFWKKFEFLAVFGVSINDRSAYSSTGKAIGLWFRFRDTQNLSLSSINAIGELLEAFSSNNIDNNITFFLGPVISMDKSMTFDTSNKTAAKYKWLFKSEKFHNKGFATVVFVR